MHVTELYVSEDRMAALSEGTMTTAEARDHFSNLLNQTAYWKQRVILTRRGKPMVAVVPVEDLTLIRELEDRIDLEEAREALKEPGSTSWNTVKARLGL